MPKLSVIVLSKNNGKTLAKTLGSIIRSDTPEGYEREIIVCDAKSTDETPLILEKFKKWIKVVYDEGKGVGIARNIAVNSSTGDIICFVDADAVVSKDHFKVVVDALNKGYDVVDVHGIPPPEVMKKWSLIARLEAYIWLYGRAYREERMLKDRAFAGTSFMCFKRSVFNDLGGFWEYPPFGSEDMDFSYRARRRGYRIGVARVKGSYSIPRQSLRELFREQQGWGEGFAYLVAKYRCDEKFLEAYKFRFLPIKHPVLYFTLRLMGAPLGGIRLLVKHRAPQLFFYWTVRRAFFFIGFLKSIRKALVFYSHVTC